MNSFYIEGEGRIPILLHLPHNSIFMPEQWEGSLEAESLKSEIHTLVDHHTDVLYRPVLEMGGSVFHNRYCRIAFDPERFAEPEREIMNEVGMGIFYTHTSTGIRFRDDDSSEEYQQKLQKYYWPYHHALSKETRDILQKFGRVLFIDGHSYPQKCFPFERFPDDDRPEIDIGTDSFHTPLHFAEKVHDIFASSYSVALDQPFRGTLVPNGVYQTENRLTALMLEVRRDVYLDKYEEGEIILHRKKIEAFHQKLRLVIKHYIDEMLIS